MTQLRLSTNPSPREVSQRVNELMLHKLPDYTVATLPPGKLGQMAFVTDETGGAVPAFFDGTDWRRVTDRAIVS